MSGFPCPYCGRAMTPISRPGEQPRPYSATRDHVLPKERGGTRATDNIRICCRRCNELRGALGHCTGALAAFLAVLPDISTTSVRRTGRAWAAGNEMFRTLPR